MFLRNAKVVSSCGQRVLLSQNNFVKIPKRNRYLVLVPEIGEDLPDKYPLLKEDKTPEFNTLTIEKCVAAIGKQTIEFEEEIKNLAKRIDNVENVSPKDLFEKVFDPMEEMYTSLNITWGIAKTLYVGNQSLMPTKCYIGIHERARRASASRYVSLPIYQACKSIISNKDKASQLSNEQERILTKFILEGKLNGLELTGTKQEELMALSLLMMNKIKEYSQKVEVASNQFVHVIKDSEIMKEFPEEILKIMVKDATQFNVGPWIVNLNSVIMNSFMEYCPVRELRQKVWEANVTKASILHDKSVETSVLLEEIRFERQKLAKLLGYKTYVDISMETKMAGSLENIYQTFDSLVETARPAQEYEIKELTAFANERGLEGAIQLWDIPYWSRRQLTSIYKYNEEDSKNYFSLPKVLSGIFELTEMLFNVKIVESKKPDVWHNDVRFFDIFDLKQSSTSPIGSFYLDAYARGGDKVRLSQGFMVPIKEKSKASNTKPLVTLIFNFQPPFGEKPSLLSFKDVKTLFQKFGHMLQHALTTVEYAEISGLSFVEWDAAYVSDYFFENWLREPSILQQISCHEDTGEPLSMEMIEILRNTNSHLSGYNLCKELYLAHFDLELHTSKEFWNNIMNRLWKKYFVIPRHKKDHHVCSFEAIVSGDFAASYYSHVWSQMIAADLYSAFEEIPSKDKQMTKEIGNKYRDTFLALGGSCPMNEVFRKFRGRDPSPKALLKNLGLDIKSKMLQTASVKV